MAFPRYAKKASQRKASGVSRIGEYRSTNFRATPSMMSLGKTGNEDSVVCFVTWLTSIVSIVLGLDGFFLLQDHHLPGFKFECYRPVEAFTGESADECEGFFHWLWDHSWRVAGSKRIRRVSGSFWDGIWLVRASSKSWPAPMPVKACAWRAVNI